MTGYLIKLILCSGFLLLVYLLLLEKEKMFRFNRFYLLFSMLFSFLVPLISFQPVTELSPVAVVINSTTNGFKEIVGEQPVLQRKGSVDIMPWIFSLYMFVTILLLIRFCRGLYLILSKIHRDKAVSYRGAKLVMTNQNILPHSFLKYIFINSEQYEAGNIDREILEHELTHAHQKHSLDILFLEFLMVFCWFNPFLLLYRKAIQLNHEYLADERVIQINNNTIHYQQLLLREAQRTQRFLLTSPFNYLITKKRLIMMTKTTPLARGLLKQIALIPLFAFAVFLFSSRVTAQDTPRVVRQPRIQAESSSTGASEDLLKEYETIVNKYKAMDEKFWWRPFRSIAPEDKMRLQTIFLQMSKEQQEIQEIAFSLPYSPMPRVVPTSQQFESFKNAAEFGVWIDGKRAKNSALMNYTRTDFSHMFISKLTLGKLAYKPTYKYQVDLMTTKYYQDYYDRGMAALETAKENKEYRMVVRRFPVKQTAY